MKNRREIIAPEGIPRLYPEFSPAVRFDDWIFVAAQLASDLGTRLAPEVAGNPLMPLAGEHRHFRESRYIFRQLEQIVAAAGGRIEDSVRIDQFPTTRAVMDPYHITRSEALASPRPASTSVLVDGLLLPAADIGVELIAILPREGFRKEAISVEQVPQSRFGIVPAIRAGDLVFVAAQIATDFETGLAPEARRNPAFWQGSEIELEARYTLKNIEAVLEAAGSSLRNVVKAFVYLTDISDIPRLDRVWRDAFPDDPPARTIIPAPALGVPETRFEINLVAVADNGKTRKEVVVAPDACAPLFHESQAIRAGNLLFLSGLTAAAHDGLVAPARINPESPFVMDTTTIQTEYILEQAEKICLAAGTRLNNSVRMLSVHPDLDHWARSHNVWRTVFEHGEPATTAIAVPAPLPTPGATVLLDLWVGI